MWPFKRKKSKKILCYFNHYFGSSSKFNGKSTSGDTGCRREVVNKALDNIRSLPFDIDVKTVGFPGNSLIDIDVDVRKYGEDPRFIVYSSIENMYSEIDGYDYIINIEDDILISDDFVEKSIKFNEESEVGEVFLPNRIEYTADGRPYCVDLLAVQDWNRELRREFSGTLLGVAVNPHSGIAFLSKEQMLYARKRIDIARREIVVGGFMASAYANLHAPFLLWRSRADMMFHHVVHLDKWHESDALLAQRGMDAAS